MNVQPSAVDGEQQRAQMCRVFELLGKGCVAFYPRLVDLTESVTAALLLGQCVYWAKNVLEHQPERNGWFWKTQAEWQGETGLSRREQESARVRLRELGLLTEERRGMPAKRWYRLDLALLEQQLDELPGHVFSEWPWNRSDLARRLGQPIVYWRRLHDVTGSVTAALYLSRTLFWQRSALQQVTPPGPWLYRPICHSQQGLRFGRRQQEHARARLKALGFINERIEAALPRRLLTRLHLVLLARRLATTGGERRSELPHVRDPRQARRGRSASSTARFRGDPVHESAIQECANPPNSKERMRQPWLAQTCTSYIEVITAEKPPPQRQPSQAHDCARGEVAVVGVLEFPNFILADQQPLLAQIVGQCPALAQTILDELAGQAQHRGQRGAIGNPLAYVRALTQKALTGAFVPELAAQVARSRARRQSAQVQRGREAEEQQGCSTAADPGERQAAEAKRVACLAQIHALLAPHRLAQRPA